MDLTEERGSSAVDNAPQDDLLLDALDLEVLSYLTAADSWQKVGAAVLASYLLVHAHFVAVQLFFVTVEHVICLVVLPQKSLQSVGLEVF